MKTDQNSVHGTFQLNATPMVIGAALMGAGGLIALTGLIVGGTAMVSATRQWLHDFDVPPSEIVKQKLGQTKAATVAGASAWQHHHDGARRAHASG